MGHFGAAPDPGRERTQALVDWLLRNGRREKLCGEVAAISGAPFELVEDALQEVCLRAATTSKCRGKSEGEVYNWLLQAALRRVTRLLDRSHLRHEVLVDWSEDDDESEHAPASDAADVEVLERERERELAELAETVVCQLNERQRQVVALQCRSVPGAEIARRLAISERRVKHLKAESFARARAALVEAAGAGCGQEEQLISRFCFGLATPGGRFAAQLHVACCERCAALCRRLERVHEKIALLLPIPAAAEADPALLERALHQSADALAQAKQQLADAASHAKQHAAAGYSRAVEYTPLASVRPGAAATAIAGCLALGGGTAAVCIDRGVDPITGLVDAVQSQPAKPKPQPPKKARVAQRTPDPPQLPPLAAPPPAAPTPAPTPEQPAPAAPAPAPEPAPPPPPEPTPAGVQFGEPATATPVPAARPARPAPVPESGGSHLYGP